MSHRFLRLMLFLVCTSLFGSSFPAAAVRTVASGSGASVPLAVPAQAVVRRAQTPMLTPPEAGSRGIPATQAADIRAQYEATHRLNGVVDGDFATPGAVSYVEPGPITLTNPENSTTIIPIPAGDYDSVEADVWVKSGHWYWGIAGSIGISPRGLPPGDNAWGTVYSGGDSGGSGSHRFTLAWAVPPHTPLDLHLVCGQDNSHGGQCIFSNIRFFRTTPGWHFGSSQTTIDLSDEVYTGVYADTYKGLAPNQGPFLGIETTHIGGGGSANHTFSLDGPLMRLPPLTSTSQLTMSLNWARKITVPFGYNPTGVDVSLVTLGDTPQAIPLLSIPAGTTDAPWTRATSTALPASVSGKVGHLRISGSQGFVPKVIGVDALTFFLDGHPVPIPSDQVAGDCACNQGARIQAVVRDPVNTFSGAFLLQTPDLVVPTHGPALTLTRNYTSLFANPTTYPTTAFGPGWRHSFAAALTLPTAPGGEANTVIYEAPSGNRLRFYDDGAATTGLDPAPGVRGTLIRASDTYTLTLLDQSIQRFDMQGRLIEQRDPQGHAQMLSYYPATGTVWDGQLAQVTDSGSGRSLGFTYQAVNGQPRIAQVSGSLSQVVSYTYTPDGDLATVTDVRGGVTTYQYTGPPHFITAVQNAIGTTQITNWYDSAGRISQQREVTGAMATYTYAQTSTEYRTTIHTTPLNGPDTESINHYRLDGSLAYQERDGQFLTYTTFDGSATPTVTVDGNGQPTVRANSSVGLPTRITNALQQATTITYDRKNRPTMATGSAAITTTATYDDQGNLTQQRQVGSDGLVQTTSYTYTLDNQVLEAVRSDGVRTRYEYNAAGDVVSVTVGYGTALAQTTTVTYDALGRVDSTTMGAGTPFVRTDTTIYNPDTTVAQTIQNYKDGIFSAAKPDEDIRTSYGYDPLGRQIWVQDVLGHYDVTHYNATGQVDWTTRNMRGYSGGALPATPPAYSPTVPDANVSTFYGYDGLGRTVLVTETGILTGTFNPTMLQFSTATNRVTRTEYDTLSRPVTVTLNYHPELPQTADTNVQTVTYYDGGNNPIWQRDALGRWTKTDYDVLGRPLQTIRNYEDGDPTTGAADSDLIETTHYDVAGRVDRTITNWVDGTFSATEPITDRVTLVQYDTLGRPTTTTANAAPAGTTPDLNRMQTTAYDPSTGRVLGQHDALGRWVQHQYDLLGRPTATVLNCTGSQVPQTCGPATADQNVTTTTHYDALGRAFETVDALGVVTQTNYDGLGRAVATTRNVVAGAPTTAITNVTTLTTYDALGRVVATTDALGQVRRTAYTALGQTRTLTDTLGRVTTMGYDGQGSLRWQQRADGQLTVYQLDGLGRTSATIVNYQDGVVSANEPTDTDLISQTGYDAAGRRVLAIDPNDRRTAFAYDNADRLLAVTENAVAGSCPTAPCNVVTQYQYDRAGNRTAIVDANGHVRTFAYDAADQQISATDALGQATRWDYDAAGRMTVQHDPRGSAFDVAYQYSGLDQITQTLSLALAAPITQHYDARGQRTALTDATGTTAFGYDPLGRMTRVQAPQTGTVGYGYDALGQRTALTYPNGTQVQYAYRADGQLADVTQDGGLLAHYSYDAIGRVQALQRANGLVTSYGYDGADRLRDLHSTVGSRTISRFQYTVDRAGLRTRVDETQAATGAQASGAPRGPAAPVRAAHRGVAAQTTCTSASAGTAVGAGLYDDPSTAITYTPAWTAFTGQARAVNGTLMRTNVAGAAASMRFTGSRIAYVYSLGPDRGSVRVCLFNSSGGVVADTLVNANAPEYRRGLVRTWQVTPGTYIVKLIAQGTNNTDLDALVVDNSYRPAGTYDNPDALIYYTDPSEWVASTGNSGATNGTLQYTDVSGAFMRFTFSGTRVQYLYSTGPNRAKALIALDGVPQTTLDLYSANYERQHSWLSPVLADGIHTLHIQLLGVDATRTRLDVDGLVVTQPAPTNTPTNTPLPPTSTPTNTPLPPTNTPLPPTNTPTNTPTATNTPLPTATATATPLPDATRVVTYAYDGLQRLVGAVEAPGTNYAYGYDRAGNRTSVTVNGTTTTTSYNAANQVIGLTYDAAGNLTSDGTATLTYDALNRLTARGTTTYGYNGDGVLVFDGTTRYTQDLAAPLSQILSDGTSTYVYGTTRLAAVQGATRTWYVHDALGSVRRTVSDTGTPLGVVNYDPWGVPESGSVPTFGFTGEVQPGADVYLRARWYNAGRGTFTTVDPFAGMAETPYSLHAYQYAYADPVLLTDASGRCAPTGQGDDYCHTNPPESTNAYTAMPLAAGMVGVGSLTLVGEGSAGAAACAVLAPCIIIVGAVGELLYFTVLPNANEHRQDLMRGAQYVWMNAQKGLTICGQWLENTFREPAQQTIPDATLTNSSATLTKEQIDQSINAAESTLAAAMGLTGGQLKFLYRGTALKRAGQPRPELWVSENLAYTTIYAHFDARVERDTPAISIYAIQAAILTQLIATGQVKEKFSNGLEYGFNSSVQSFLVGPVIVPISFSYKG